MKKKFFSFLLSLCLVVPCMFSLTACKKDPPPHTNAEYDEFRAIVDSVLTTYKMDDANPTAYGVSNAEKWATAMAISTDNRVSIVNMINNDTDKTSVNAEYYYQDALEQSFYMPLICGDVFAYTLKKSNFYGEKMLMETNMQYIMVESIGSHKYVYCYTPAGEIYDENYYNVLDLNYTSAQDYEFVMIGFNADYTSTSYIYGDESKNLLIVEEDSSGDQDSNFVVATLGSVAYESTNADILTAAYGYVSGEIKEQDKTKIQNLATGTITSISDSAYQTAMDNYFDTSNDIQTITHDWDISQGFVYGYYGSSTEITIPSTATCIANDFQVSSTVTKLTIPASITSIKVGEMEDPLTGFDLYACFEWRTTSLTEIVVEAGSTFFKAIDGNLYTTDGRLLWVANGSAITDLELSESAITAQLLREPAQLPNLKNITFVDGEYIGGGYGFGDNIYALFASQTKTDFELETVTLSNLITVTTSVNLAEIFDGKVVSIQTLNLAALPQSDKVNVTVSGSIEVTQINVDEYTTLVDNRT